MEPVESRITVTGPLELRTKPANTVYNDCGRRSLGGSAYLRSRSCWACGLKRGEEQWGSGASYLPWVQYFWDYFNCYCNPLRLELYRFCNITCIVARQSFPRCWMLSCLNYSIKLISCCSLHRALEEGSTGALDQPPTTTTNTVSVLSEFQCRLTMTLHFKYCLNLPYAYSPNGCNPDVHSFELLAIPLIWHWWWRTYATWEWRDVTVFNRYVMRMK